MVKSGVVSRIADRFSRLNMRDTELSVSLICAAMLEALQQGRRVEIRSFGIFRVHLRGPRVARNPKSGEAVNVPAKPVLRFKPGKLLSERVRGRPPIIL